MKIVILGSGLMGPAAAYNALVDSDVEQVVLCDASQAQLDGARRKLARLTDGAKLKTVQLDLRDQAAAGQALDGADAVVGALPKPAVHLGVRAAVAARVPIVDLSAPTEPQVAALQPDVEAAGTLAIMGCGVEPGLTEIMARYLAEKVDHAHELHIKCGGIPDRPAPPLGYKIVFGGRNLPLRDADGCRVENGELKPATRYGDVEAVTFAGVGECEAWHESFMPWLLKLEPLKGLKSGTQKTVRWPGYAAKASMLRELGMLSTQPVAVDGVEVAPKHLLDAVLYPRVRLEDGERDITLFRVELTGQKDGHARRYKIEMVDRYDDRLGFTSMARTTAFTGAIVARMVARGDLRAQGWVTPEEVIAGPLFERLVHELADANVVFDLTSETVERLA